MTLRSAKRSDASYTDYLGNPWTLLHTVWWCTASDPLNAKDVTATFENWGIAWPGHATQTLVAFGVHGCDLLDPFDPDLSLPAESDCSGTTRTTHNVLGVSTASQFTFVFESDTIDATAPVASSLIGGSTDSDWLRLAHVQGAGQGELDTYVACKRFNVPLVEMTHNVFAEQTAAAGDIASIDALRPPRGPESIWASTEAADTFAGTGWSITDGLVAGIFAKEAKDAFTATGYLLIHGSWATREARDGFSAYGYQLIAGSWATSEVKDALAMAGHTPGTGGPWISTEAIDAVNAIGYTASIGPWSSHDAADIFFALELGTPVPRGRRIFLAC
jgi:hypothetical protein